MLFPPGFEIGLGFFVGGGIKADDRAALVHFFYNEILERGHFDGLSGDLVGEVGRDDDHTIAVADYDVARKYRCVTAADGNVDVDGLMDGQVGGGGRAMMERGDVEFRDLG